ncbi:hypothetical protein C1645_820552 [Glomus cerebriforme]|uniref:Uncharacterized protein n=1 Tax=Glomus cerebriforme TaxID=658196 RepID=A0A397T2Z9_9GLOM|nr:hypothetical protein C1645_820552 [Glomus cerebriforme]
MAMINTHITSGKLVATGSIVPELHYGPYLRDWWVFSKEKIQKNSLYPIPLHLGLEIMLQLNKNPFIIHVVHHIHSPLQSGYICEEGGYSSDIVESASKAITSVYQLVFGTQTKYAGLFYLGLDQPEIVQKLVEGILFYPFIVELEKISVFVGCLGKINQSNINKIRQNYSASLFYKYKGKQYFANAVWNQTGILKSVSISIPSNYMIMDWNNRIIMEHLFKLHLKKVVGGLVEEWFQIFQDWKQQKSNIIELYNHIGKIYNSNHEFQERELRGWRVMFHAAGCTNITPKEIHNVEFWMNALDPKKDREMLANLYMDGFLKTYDDSKII